MILLCNFKITRIVAGALSAVILNVLEVFYLIAKFSSMELGNLNLIPLYTAGPCTFL